MDIVILILLVLQGLTLFCYSKAVSQLHDRLSTLEKDHCRIKIHLLKQEME